ncbi:GFA family protein [Aureimonas populi]|uniref:GFA family protein n=1 Tax=Aureimonas populi TaxID=1701758 RepID=A0ABW5CHP4_9HYPH|nr:GFA family protein [Aureimonas populi]
MTQEATELPGGCLCGAIRYRATGYDRAVHCHCGACRKATGAAFTTWVCIPEKDFALLAGRPAYRRSSAACNRGFCAACGTPLFMLYDGDGEVTVSLGSLDEPRAVRVSYQIWTEERLAPAPAADLPSFPRDPH